MGQQSRFQPIDLAELHPICRADDRPGRGPYNASTGVTALNKSGAPY
jgi:hypothetical protein